jgi:nucleotide-binding universal stress UspA family protein
MVPLKAVLVPIDFADNNRGAFALAESLARDHGARLILVHVVLSPPFVSPREMEKAMRDPNEYRQELIEKIRSYRPRDSRLTVEYHIVLGDPIEEIVETARARHCDLIVMSTHGRSGVRRLLMGSVAEGVLRKAPCPVITFREPVPMETAEHAESSMPACVP